MGLIFDPGWVIIQRKSVVYSEEFYARESSEGKT
jgi:hypothetical protein